MKTTHFRGSARFSFNVDFFNDDRIVALSGEFGPSAQLLAVHLLCLIHRNGYFLEVTDMVRFRIMASIAGLSESDFQCAIERMVDYGIFDRTPWRESRVLTSRAIQQRYFTAARLRRLAGTSIPYFLMDDDAESASASASTSTSTIQSDIPVKQNAVDSGASDPDCMPMEESTVGEVGQVERVESREPDGDAPPRRKRKTGNVKSRHDFASHSDRRDHGLRIRRVSVNRIFRRRDASPQRFTTAKP